MSRLALCVSALLVLLMALNENYALMPCCTEYYETPIAFKYLKNFTIQEVTESCNIKAVIFKLQKGKFVCANPHKPWVKKAIEYIHNKP